MTDISNLASNLASAFVKARLSAQAIETYPGPVPQTLASAYDIQDLAISAWPEPVAGWKVGRIQGDDAVRFGTDRLAGPIFSSQVTTAGDAPSGMPVFKGGFAAVEGECVIITARDAPADKTDWTRAEAIDMIGAIHAGIEIASSPFAGINDLGPLVTISDFGNNYGLVIGDMIPDWWGLATDEWSFETIIGDTSVGKATPSAIPGGPVESFRFMLENAAHRGMPLKKGSAISTGAVTGVHLAAISDSAIVRASGVRDIHIRLIEAEPWTEGAGASHTG
ncbi:2-keto-4-pentenoate hydratase [Hyphomonas sp.]|uniref:2-keto-4-pentenoate hydratase n=1 Tax=Hyphomonas sp. TaxID=87 RepID=UPI0032ECE9E6